MVKRAGTGRKISPDLSGEKLKRYEDFKKAKAEQKIADAQRALDRKKLSHAERIEQYRLATLNAASSGGGGCCGG